MIKLIYLFCLALLISCGFGNEPEKSFDNIQNNKLDTVDTIRKINADTVTKIYEYIYPNNTSNLIENQYIKLKEIGNKYEGLYYGTSDEFDEVREGYYPGFFVAKMENLRIQGDSIEFRLTVPNEKILTTIVDLKIESFEQAISNGNKRWPHKMTLEPKSYLGIFTDSNTIFFKGNYDFLDKTFIRK